MIDNPLFADEIFGFHARQAMEKALKAWLASLSRDFPLTHDSSWLLGLLEEPTPKNSLRSFCPSRGKTTGCPKDGKTRGGPSFSREAGEAMTAYWPRVEFTV